MASNVTTSVVVNFTDLASSGGILTAEIDSRDVADGGLNPNGSTFYAGDEPIFLVYMSSDVTIAALQPSEGSINSLGNVTVLIEQDVTLANEREARMDKPYLSGFTVVSSSPGAPALTVSGETTMVTASNTVAAYRVKYYSSARAYQLVGASGLISVVIYIEGYTS